MDSETTKREKVIEDALATLSEHFDHVQIMATISDVRGTLVKYAGKGNWYARQGMAHEFINTDIAQDTASQIAAKLKEE